MQPDRPCYVRRAADEQLLEAIAEQRFAYVLAPRAMGKSSLMGRTLRRLRADGQLAAVVDLSQIGSRGESVDAARWHYSVAYRICRELRLKVDLQAWWHDKSLLLNEQRLIEFFWEVVLANTTTPVTIFFDEVECAVELPFAQELCVAIYGCTMRRVSEPDFSRLNFVVLGAATPDQLCPDPNVSPFASGRAIRLEDFTLEESATLIPGLRQPDSAGRTLLARVHVWTRGQPYLTQKLLRGIMRRGGKLTDVDAVLHEQLLAPGISREEPLLGDMRRQLTNGSPRSRQAVAMLGRLTRGQEVIVDPGSHAQQLLNLAGLISSDENGMVRFRNRIVEQVFGGDFAGQQTPRRWQRPVGYAAATAAAVALVAYWYARVLPSEPIATLSGSTDYALVERAHDRLARLPGFGVTADRLLGDAMARRSRVATSFGEVREADRVLRTLPGSAIRADALFADYWLRQSEGAAGRGERDAALLNALAAVDAGSLPARALAANLIDGDYAALQASFRLDAPPLAAEVDWERDRIVVVDAGHRILHLPLVTADNGDVAATRTAIQPLPTRLTALQQVGVTRGIFVDVSGRAGALELRLTVEHGRTGDLLVRLRAPSGAAAELELPERDGTLEQFAFTASVQNGLLRLADESITGQWELTVFDRLSGETGRLLSWSLHFSGQPQQFPDTPVDGLPLPDPVRTEQIDVALSADGRIGVAIPSRPDARGAASIWDLTRGERLGDLPLVERAQSVDIIAPDRLLVVSLRRITLWDTAAIRSLADFRLSSDPVASPAISADGKFLAIAEPFAAGARISVVSVDDGSVVSRFETPLWTDWALGPQASYLALVDGSRRGRVIEPLTGDLAAEFFHDSALERVIPARSSDSILAVDVDGQLLAWPLTPQGGALSPSQARVLGRLAAPDSTAVAADARALAFLDQEGLVSVLDPTDGLLLAALGVGRGTRVATRLAPESDRIVTLSDGLIRYWKLDREALSGPDFGPISAVALNADGTLGALGYRDGQVRLLPGMPAAAHNGTLTDGVTGHRGVVTSLAISASGELAASGSSDGVVRVWNTRTGARSPFVLRHPSGPIRAIAISADDHWLVSAGSTSARLFELATGRLEAEIEVDGTPVSVAIAPDSRLVAIGDSAGNIFLATPGGVAGISTIRGRSAITALAFGDSRDVLVSGSADGDLVLWDTLTATALEGAYRFGAPVRWLAVEPGNTRLWVRSGVWLHRLDRGEGGARIGTSRLLPDRLRHVPALALSATDMVRGLADAGGGRLAVADITTAAPDSAAPEPPPLDGRDWRHALGMELDRTTGTLRELGL